MKRLLNYTIILSLSLVVFGCGGPGPETEVERITRIHGSDSSPDGTYSFRNENPMRGQSDEILVIVNGDKWDYISSNKVQSGIVEGNSLLDKHHRPFGEINTFDGTIGWSGGLGSVRFTLKKK